MSVHDKVRDTLYGSPADERKSERSAAGYADLTDSMDRPFLAQKSFVSCAAAEALLIGVIFFDPGHVLEIVSWPDTFVYAALVFFAVGFFAAFAAYKIYRNDIALDDAPIGSGVMSGYSGYELGQGQFIVWLIASAGGVLNIVLLFSLLVMLA